MLKHTPVLSLVLQIAAIEAADSHYEFIEPEHLFIALCKLEGFANVNRLRALGVPDGQVSLVEAEIDLLMGLFKRFGINTTTFRHELRQYRGLGSYQPPNGEDIMVHRSPESRAAFDEADKIAAEVKAPMVAIFHLCAALLKNPVSSLATWLQGKRVDIVTMAAEAKKIVIPAQIMQQEPIIITSSKDKSDDPLTRYGLDLSERVRAGKIKPYPDLEENIMQTMRALNRPQKNNALLLLEDDNDSEKIINHLVWRLSQDDAPSQLGNMRLIQINLAELAKNISYQGEFAKRVQIFINALLQQNGILLIVNDIHTIIGSGSLRGDMAKAAQTFKEVLVNKRLQCVGLTVPGEYYEYIGRDLDLREQFQPISVGHQANIKPADTAEFKTDILTLDTPSLTSTYGTAILPSEEKTNEPISTDHHDVVDEAIDQLESRLWRFGLRLQFRQSAIALLSRIYSAPGGGEPALDQALADKIEGPIGAMLLRGDIKEGQKAVVSVIGGEFVVRAG